MALAAVGPPVWAIVLNAVLLGEHLTDPRPVYTLHAALRPGANLVGLPPLLIPVYALPAAAAAALAVGAIVRGTGREQSGGAALPEGA